MKKVKIVIHMLDDGMDGIEGIVGKIEGGSVEITLSWRRDQNRCGPFTFEIGPVAKGEEKHFGLILKDIELPIPDATARIFSQDVGLKPWENGHEDRAAEIIWAEPTSPCYVRGYGTPYPLEESGEQTLRRHENPRHRDFRRLKR